MRRRQPAANRPAIAKATCPLCGDVEMLITDITLHLQLPSYSFTCPICWDLVEKPANPIVDEALFVHGAVVVV